MVHTLGAMAKNIKVIGKLIKWKVMEFLLGQMAECMKVTSKTIRKTDMELIIGQMAASMLDNGEMVCNMEWDNLNQQMEK